MSITGSNNPFACNPVVFANANSIVSLGTITRDGNQFTFSVGFVWKINGVTYQNTAPVVITITEASTGFQRIDNALLNTSNTIELQQGLESDTIALRPVAPETNIILTSWNISGTTIGDAEASILGTQFKKKSENAAYNDPTLTGADAVISLQPNGQSVYAFSNAGLTSIDGFGLDLITGNPSAEVPYAEKDILIYNNKAGNLTLKHDGSGTADVKFLLEGSVDLVIPAGGKVWLKYGPSYCELIFKSWSDVKDVIEGYFNGTNFYTDSGFTNLITPESSKIYITLDSNLQYRWSGTAYVQIGGGIKTESVTIANRWTLTNANVYYRSRGDFGGFNVDTLNASTAVSTITSAVASLSSAFYCTKVSKALSKIYIDGSNVTSTLTDFKLGVFAFQRANAVAPTAINIITIGEFTLTKASGDGSHFWEVTPTNLEIPAGYLVSCVLMRTGGTGTEINCSMTFKFDDYVA